MGIDAEMFVRTREGYGQDYASYDCHGCGDREVRRGPSAEPVRKTRDQMRDEAHAARAAGKQVQFDWEVF